MGAGMCSECSKRALCKHLCPEAEAYENQDHVSLREITAGIPSHGKPWPQILRPRSRMSPKQKDFVMALLDGKSKTTICKGLNLKSNSFDAMLHRLRKRMSNA